MNKYKEIRKMMIDKDITWNFIIEKSKNYTVNSIDDAEINHYTSIINRKQSKHPKSAVL